MSEDLVDYRSGRLRLGGVNFDSQLQPGLLTLLLRLLQQRRIEIGRHWGLPSEDVPLAPTPAPEEAK